MKKLLALALAVVMLLTLVACGGNEKTTTGGSVATTAPATTGKNPQTTAPGTTVPGTTVPGTTVPGTTVPGTTVPGTTVPGTTVPGGDDPVTPPTTEAFVIALKTKDEYADAEVVNASSFVGDKEYGEGKDYWSLYEVFGGDAVITDVIEDLETGISYIEKDGKLYPLGLDFLSMAMVYNCQIPEGEEFADCTADDVYATWWRLYIQRWNILLPEIPLYSNEYYDLYNTQITGVQEHPTNPYWGPASALIDWASTKDDKSIIIGNTTDLSGKFRYSSYGATNPGAADLDVESLTSGLATVTTTKEGGYTWDSTVVESHTETENADGSKTFTIKINENLKFSDGSAVTAKNYVIHALVFSTPVAAEAASKDHMSAMTIAGYDSFAAYTGAVATASEEEDAIVPTKELSGLRLIDEYTFSVTIDAGYLPYFYDIAYAGFSPVYTSLWLNTCDVKDDGNGCYLTDDFYAKNDDGTYALAAHIKASSLNTDNTYPYSGPYCVESYDASTKTATLVKNTYYVGNYEGTVPAIEKVIYKKVVSATQLDDMKAGGIDVIAGITGGDETNEALTFIEEGNGKYDAVHYSRAGYGKMGFRADYGPAQFTEVRQAIAYCMDRATFAKDFTGGFGGVVDAPYYAGSWMYQHALAQGMILNAYDTSLDSAIDVLVAGGWVYNAEGGAYTEGVRYKKIPAAQATENDINYQSKDGAYKTTKVGDDYYMPLVLNWYGTSENPFTDLLVTGFETNANILAAGFAVQKNIGEFDPMLDELYQAKVYGYYAGTPMYCIFNFATGFTSAAYDYSWNLTINPSMYDDYSAYYIKDAADFYWYAE